MFFTELQTHLLELELLNLTRASQGELVDEEHIFGNLITGNLAATEELHVFGSHLRSLFENNEGSYGLAIFLGRHGSDLYVADARHVIEELFYFARIDILTASNNHVLDMTRNLIEAFLVLHTQIA